MEVVGRCLKATRFAVQKVVKPQQLFWYDMILLLKV
jgi:hypothetical protein